MRPEHGLQTWHDSIHLIAAVRGRVVAGTHCGLVLPVVPEDLTGRETCAACFRRWIETDEAMEWETAPTAASPAPATPAAPRA